MCSFDRGGLGLVVVLCVCVYGGRGIGALIGHLDGALVGGERVVSKLL